MLTICKVLQFRNRFSPVARQVILLSSNCCFNKPDQLSVSRSAFSSKKLFVAVPKGKDFGKRYYASRSFSKGDEVLVYHGHLTPQIRMVKIFSLCSSLAGLASQPILYKHASELGGMGVIIGVATFVGFFTFVTPVLLHLITKKYVTDIYHNETTDAYTASLLTFFLRVKKVTFKADEVYVPDVPGLFTTFKVKGLSMFVDPKMFDNPHHYGKLMGYDKPIDFLLKKEVTSDSSEGSEMKAVKK